MSLFSVIKYDGNSHDFVWKYPIEDLHLGSQLIVRPGQTVFFCRSGKIYDEFTEGTYTIKSYNIPLLNKLINIPFGNESPFQAEVWFVNTLSVLDLKWGTPKPILLKDPEFNIIVPVRAFGKYGITISNARLFFTLLIGTIKSFSAHDIYSYFSGLIITHVSDSISSKIMLDKVSVLEIPAYLKDLSDFVYSNFNHNFEEFGIKLVNFFIMSINIPVDDSSVLALKEATEKRMHIDTVGRDVYSFDRSMDVMDKAASNQGTGSDLMGAAMGLGMGFALGPKLGNQIGQIGSQMNTGLDSAPPPPIAETQYFVYHDNQQYGPFDLNTMKAYIQQGLINAETPVWKSGMANWSRAKALPELALQLSTSNVTTPPPPPTDS